MSEIAVLYLARINEGLNHFENFARSYQKHAAGENHDLIIIYKGDFKRGQKAGAEHIFKDMPHQSFPVPDDIGFDIHAYMHVAAQINHKYICILNTYTELLTTNWLKKLYAHLKKSNVGLVGTTGSYESGRSSLKLIQNVLWLTASEKVLFNKELAQHFSWIISNPKWVKALNNQHLQKNKSFGIYSVYGPLYFLHKIIFMFFSKEFRKLFIDWKYHKNLLYSFFKNINTPINSYIDYADPILKKQFSDDWHSATQKGNGLHFLTYLPPFPNPHLRSNGIMIERKLFLEFQGIEKTKFSCCIFESGYDGLTNRILRKGLKILLIGADGVAYPPEEWPKSQTFRLDKQKNLITSDNQTASYQAMSKPVRDIHDHITWGEYLGKAPQVISKLGYSFKKDTLAPPPLDLKVSVVIPTHNRLHLVKDAIFSILQQTYKNWELVVFDNFSSDPIKKYIDSLQDKRIIYRRSTEFLPVTDSWNQAIDYATGEYIILLGDDDGLAPHYFQKIKEFASTFDNPDLIYSGLYVFAHPGVFPNHREGFLDIMHNAFFFKGKTDPYLLESHNIRKAWTGSVNFKRNFAFNMQGMTFRKSFLNKLRRDGKIFHSPFPDYYLANLAMGCKGKILICPEPIAIQGISTASFGYTLFNNLEEKGAKLLNTKFTQDILFKEYKEKLIPGEAYQANYILTMGHVLKNVPDSISAKEGIKRYRRHQIFFHLHKQKSLFWLWNTQSGSELRKRLTNVEKIWTFTITLLYLSQNEKLTTSIRKSISNTDFPAIQRRLATGEFATLPEVFGEIQKGTYN